MNVVVIFGMLLATVIVGNCLLRHVPQISCCSSLIGLGLALAISCSRCSFTIDPSASSLLMFAPRFSNEGVKLCRGQIGRCLTNIVCLLVGLVIVSVVILGSGVQLLSPVFPLSLALLLMLFVTPTELLAVWLVLQANPLSTSVS